MNKLKLLVLHCTATPEGRIVTAKDIVQWHTAPVSKGGRGWSKVGYSDLIALDGRIINLADYNEDQTVDPWEMTNGTVGINAIARHVVYAGGVDKDKLQPKDTRTNLQLLAMEFYIKRFLMIHTDCQIAGHNQFAAKACPSFDVPKYLKSLGITEKNIYKK